MRPATLAEARLEFEARLEGEPHREPLLTRDHVPPLNLPWPEYVTTARGAEWVNPFDAEPLMVSSGSTDSMERHSPPIT
jgi:aminobenzoyl-glutamate utilization protein B